MPSIRRLVQAVSYQPVVVCWTWYGWPAVVGWLAVDVVWMASGGWLAGVLGHVGQERRTASKTVPQEELY